MSCLILFALAGVKVSGIFENRVSSNPNSRWELLLFMYLACDLCISSLGTSCASHISCRFSSASCYICTSYLRMSLTYSLMASSWSSSTGGASSPSKEDRLRPPMWKSWLRRRDSDWKRDRISRRFRLKSSLNLGRFPIENCRSRIAMMVGSSSSPSSS